MRDKVEADLKKAAALKYSPEKGGAPKLVALGRGDTAEKIIASAKENDVPVYEDSKLVHSLNMLKIGDEIPAELYEVVARILVFVSSLDSRFGDNYGNREKG